MKKKLLFITGIILTLMIALFGPASVGAQPPEMTSVLIGFDRQPGPNEEALIIGAGGNIKYNYTLIPAISASLPEQAIQGLLKNPRITVIEPDVQVFAIDAELDNTWGVKHIGAGIVHDSGNTGAGIKVAVIDSGVDYNHPDLAANYVGGYDFVNGDAYPMDDNGHGTHVAGTIAALDNGVGVVGVAPGAKIYALKVLNASGSGSFSDVIAALEWCIGNGIQVTNNSYGSSGDPGTLTKQAFDNAEAAGLINIAAAGNSGTRPGKGDNVIYPARWASTIAVAATDSQDRRASWSSTGPDVEISAPGVSIRSTIVGGGYGLMSGTSMASPHVAGVAALVIASGITDANGNGYINDEVRLVLQQTADDLGATGKDDLYGYGLVNAVNAVGFTPVAPDPAVNVSLSTDKAEYINGADNLAVLKAVVTDENGDGISGLEGSSFEVWVDAATASVAFYETSQGNYEGNLDISLYGEGNYSVVVTVTDNRGISGSSSTGFSVVAEPTEPGQDTAYISISMSKADRQAGPNTFTKAIATITILDANGNPVAGATVSGYWGGLTTDTDSALTGSNGVVVIESDQVKNASGTFTFTIESITKDGTVFILSGDTSGSISN